MDNALDTGVIFASQNTIYAWHSGLHTDKPATLRERFTTDEKPLRITSVAYLKGSLYDASLEHGVLNTLTSERVGRNQEGAILGLGFHQGRLVQLTQDHAKKGGFEARISYQDSNQEIAVINRDAENFHFYPYELSFLVHDESAYIASKGIVECNLRTGETKNLRSVSWKKVDETAKLAHDGEHLYATSRSPRFQQLTPKVKTLGFWNPKTYGSPCSMAINGEDVFLVTDLNPDPKTFRLDQLQPIPMSLYTFKLTPRMKQSKRNPIDPVELARGIESTVGSSGNPMITLPRDTIEQIIDDFQEPGDPSPIADPSHPVILPNSPSPTSRRPPITPINSTNA